MRDDRKRAEKKHHTRSFGVVNGVVSWRKHVLNKPMVIEEDPSQPFAVVCFVRVLTKGS